MRFLNRHEAGRLLAEALDKYKGQPCVVLALPRGGVVLGVEIAKHLDAPLDLIIPRKIGHPSYREYAICAVTEDGHLVCNEEEVNRVDPEWLKSAVQEERDEAKRRRLAYLKNRQPIDLTGKVAIITDDGIATGLTIIAAIQEVKDRRPGKVVVAIPVIPSDTYVQLQNYVDEVVALEIAEDFLGSVGAYYYEFDQVEDKEVMELLNSLGTGASTTGGSK